MLDIAKVRRELERYRGNPAMVAQMIKCDAEIAKAGLEEDAWRFANPDRWQTTYEDVVGLIDRLEAWQKEQER